MPALKSEDEINNFTRDFVKVAELGILKIQKFQDASSQDSKHQTSRQLADPPNPMQVGEANKKDIETVKALISECDEKKRPLNKLSDQEKLELLLRVMSELDPLNLQRDKDESHKPRTVDEVLKDKKWDCDEIARVYTAIAWDLGVTNVAQFIARLRDKETAEVVGHAAVLYKTETGILYLDPATGNKRHFEGFTGFDDLIKNKDFQSYLSDVCSPYNESRLGYDFVEGATISGKENADAVYHYEMGNHYFNQGKDADALPYYEKACEKKMELANLYFNIGQCHYFKAKTYDSKNERESEYKQAAKYFNSAIAIKTNNPTEEIEQYGFLGDCHYNLSQYDDSIKKYGRQLKLLAELENKLTEKDDKLKIWIQKKKCKAVLDIADAYVGVGRLKHDEAMKMQENEPLEADKLFNEAINQYDAAESKFLEVYNEAKKNGLEEELKGEMKRLYLNRHYSYSALGNRDKIKENALKSLETAKQLNIGGLEELEKAAKQ